MKLDRKTFRQLKSEQNKRKLFLAENLLANDTERAKPKTSVFGLNKKLSYEILISMGWKDLGTFLFSFFQSFLKIFFRCSGEGGKYSFMSCRL